MKSTRLRQDGSEQGAPPPPLRPPVAEDEAKRKAETYLFTSTVESGSLIAVVIGPFLPAQDLLLRNQSSDPGSGIRAFSFQFGNGIVTLTNSFMMQLSIHHSPSAVIEPQSPTTHHSPTTSASTPTRPKSKHDMTLNRHNPVASEFGSSTQKDRVSRMRQRPRPPRPAARLGAGGGGGRSRAPLAGPGVVRLGVMTGFLAVLARRYRSCQVR